MKTKATRQEVYAALDTERAYQESRWQAENMPGGPASRQHSLEEWLVYMQSYLSEAINQVSRNGVGSYEYNKALDTIRKITAMGVACMEQHGAPIRFV